MEIYSSKSFIHHFILKQPVYICKAGFIITFTNKRGDVQRHLPPENLCGAESFTSGAIASGGITTETYIGYRLTGPGQRALERAAQVVKSPCYNDVIVETHQRGHTEHPNANTYKKRHSLKYLRKTGYTLLCKDTI